MARRRSLQNRPTSPGPPTSVHEPVLDLKNETREDVATTSARKRSSSVAGFFTKLLPSHRPERSGTLRDQGFWEQQHTDHPQSKQRPGPSHAHGSDSIVSSGWNPAIPLPEKTKPTQDSRPKRQSLLRVHSQPIGARPKSLTLTRQKSAGRDRQQDGQPINVTEKAHTEAQVATPTVSRRPSYPGHPAENVIQRLVTTFDAKREARRQRRSLKESGDFLGVQGINPHTGVMDVLTPTSSSPTDRTMMSAPEPRGYSESMSDFRTAYQRAARTRDAEEVSLERLRKEQERLDMIQRKKESIRALQQRVRWRREKNQWSSVAEPDLSPIADASTRSRGSRSVSDGAIVPPPAIQKVLRWEEQRSISTPAGLKTAASTPQDRPGVVTQESSDTIIHTPHPDGERRYSVITDILGNGANRSSPEAARRASEPGPNAGVASPGSSSSNRAIYRKPVPPPKDKQPPPPLKITIPGSVEQATHPGPSVRRNSFLGARIETGEAGHHHRKDSAIEIPSTPMKIDQEDSNRSGGPANISKTPTKSSPDVAVRDFASVRNRRVWFVDQPPSPGSPPRKNPNIDQSQGIDPAIATSSQSQRKTLHLYRGPLIPLRLGSNRQDARPIPSSEAKDTAVNLAGTGVQSKKKDSQTSRWAQQLMEDLARFGQDTENSRPTAEDGTGITPPTGVVEATQESPRAEITTTKELPKYAYTPITTITGYDPRLLAHTRGLRRRPHPGEPAGNSAFKDARVSRVSAMEAATKAQLERARENANCGDKRVAQVSAAQLIDTGVKAEAEEGTDRPAQKTEMSTITLHQPTRPNFDLLASPPRLPPNSWPSLDIPDPHRWGRHGIPMSAKHQQGLGTSGPKTEMSPYGAGFGPANGTTSPPQSPLTKDYHNGADLAISPKTASINYPEDLPPIIPTTSAPQLVATRERCERLYRRVSRHHPKGPSRETAMTPVAGSALTERYNNEVLGAKENPVPTPASPGMSTILVPYRPRVTTASLTYTSTYQASAPRCRSRQSLSASSSSTGSEQAALVPEPDIQRNLNQQQVPRFRGAAVREPATEAARKALTGRTQQQQQQQQHGAATARVVHVASQKRRPAAQGGETMTTGTAASTAAAWDPDGARRGSQKGSGRAGREALLGNAGADTDGRFSGTNTGKANGPRKAIPLKRDVRRRAEPVGVPDLVVRAVAAYWDVIAPAFDAGSPISQRFSAGRSTWHDCVVYLLALMFVLAAFLAAVWGVKGMLLVAGLAKAVVRGCMVLVGL